MSLNAGRRVRAARHLLWGTIGLLGFAGIALLTASGGLVAATSTSSLGGPAHASGGLPAALVGTSSPDASSAAPAVTPAVVLDPVAPQVLASVPVGSAPVMAAYDPQNGYVYVVNFNSANISVISGTSVVGTISLAPNMTGSPAWVGYDPVNTLVYVVDRYNAEGTSGAVTVIYGLTVTATVNVGTLPNSAAVDAASGAVYVTNSGGANVSVIQGNRSVGSVPAGTHPWAAAFDPADGYVYVANNGSANVSVIAGTSVAGSIAAGVGPDAVAYDPADQEVYVANYGDGTASVLTGLSAVATVPVGSGPSFAAYDPQNGSVVVTNSAGANLSVLNGSTVVLSPNVGSGPVWAAFGPAGGFGYAVNSLAGTVSAMSSLVPFASIAVGALPTSQVLDPSNGYFYVTNSGSGNVSVLAPAFQVTFDESGLAAGTAWSVTFASSSASSTGSAISFARLPGSYAYSIAPPTGYLLLSATPTSPVAVVGANVTVDVVFGPVGASSSYTLTFVESGLGGYCQSIPPWSVTVGNQTKTTTGTSVSFSLTNGTYAYSITPPSGYVVASSTPPSPVVIAGANATVSVVFQKSCYQRAPSIVFEEEGLRWGTTWCVQLNGTTQCSSHDEIRFSGLPRGSYSFVIGNVTGYTADPSSGTVELAGENVYVEVEFSAVEHHHHGCGGGGDGGGDGGGGWGGGGDWLPVARS